MKKTLGTILLFALALAALMCVSVVRERLGLDLGTDAAAPTPTPAVETSAGEAEITFADTGCRVAGTGAYLSSDTVVTIAWPGTYRVSGASSDGQLAVDCGDAAGTVTIVLEGLDLTCASGPAVYVAQAEYTVLELAAGTENALRDGADYTVTEGQKTYDGAAIYSADDLTIRGEGSLSVTGAAADGIRSKDGLTVAGGSLTVTAASAGLQGSDWLSVTGGSLTVTSGGDGLRTTEGDVTLSGGTVTVVSAGDGIDAAEDAVIAGTASLTVTAWHGHEYYGEIAVADLSAKGVKGTNVIVSGGAVTLDAADDGLHAGRNVTVSGGTVTVSSGDDALHADGEVALSGGAVAVVTAYEGLEAACVTFSGGTLTVSAEEQGIDAGSDGLTMTGGTASVAAARAVSVDGALAVQGGTLLVRSTGSESPLAFGSAAVTGGTVVALGLGTQAELTEGGELPGSLLYLLSGELAADTAVTVADGDGDALLSLTAGGAFSSVLVASGALGQGQTYTLTAGDETLSGALAEGCTVVQAAPAASGEPGGFGGDMGGSRDIGGGPGDMGGDPGNMGQPSQ